MYGAIATAMPETQTAESSEEVYALTWREVVAQTCSSRSMADTAPLQSSCMITHCAQQVDCMPQSILTAMNKHASAKTLDSHHLTQKQQASKPQDCHEMSHYISSGLKKAASIHTDVSVTGREAVQGVCRVVSHKSTALCASRLRLYMRAPCVCRLCSQVLSCLVCSPTDIPQV